MARRRAAERIRFALRPSSSLVSAIGGLEISGLVLDAPCGFGRNARFLAESGLTVACLDRDQNALLSLRNPRYRLWLPSHRRRRVSSGCGQLLGICSDLLACELPFASGSLSLVVNVHFTVAALFDEFARVLKPGGHLFIETVGGQGQNYKQLPAPGELRRRLSGAFVFRRYLESTVGPPEANAVAVKLLAIRKPRRALDPQKTPALGERPA